MKIYYGRNRKGDYKASLNPERLAKFQDVKSVDIDEKKFHNRLFMVQLYLGYDYPGFGVEIQNVLSYSRPYHSVTAAKKDSLWKDKEKLLKENPNDYHSDDFFIASDDCGEPFSYGDCFQNMFRVSIIPIRIIE
jgi:hypothetical protein